MTDPLAARTLMRGQLRFLVEQDFDVHVITSPGAELDAVAREEGVDTIGIEMRREIALTADAVALGRLYRTLRTLKPCVVVASTPKAALLGLLAACLARVPTRFVTLRGLRLETTRGLKRRVLYVCERITMLCAHHAFSVSPSLRKRYIELGLTRPEHITVPGCGSSNGIDVDRFRPGSRDERMSTLEDLRIPPASPVIGFVGRLTHDKGVDDLFNAFASRIQVCLPEARLLVVGDFEPGDPTSQQLALRARCHPNVVFAGFVSQPERYYRAMHVVALPSYREGFPNVALEAAASAVPTVAYSVTGSVDAIVDHETGRLISVGDHDQLAEALLEYLANPGLRRRHGHAARARVLREFTSRRVWQAWRDEYLDKIRGGCSDPPCG